MDRGVNMSNANEQAPPPSFAYLHKIYSIKKQLQIFDILQAIHPTHPERLWLVGFLKYTGYSHHEVIDIIDKHGEWGDYDKEYTAYQVATVYKQSWRPRDAVNNNTSKRKARKWDLTASEEYRCKYYRTLSSHRELQQWLQENDVQVYDAAPELPFDAALLAGVKK